MLEELVDRTHALLRATPGVRRVAPSLAATWHDVDGSRLLYQARRSAWRVRHGRRARFPLTIGFTPDAPRYFHGAYQLCIRLDVDVVSAAEADVVFHWADVTVRDDPPSDLDLRAINARVHDISKRHVSEVHGQVFGYDLEPEPGAKEFVEKSDANAAHDGRVVTRPSPGPGMVIERLIDNRVDERLVLNRRVSIMDGRFAWTVQRYRTIEDRFYHGRRSLWAVVVDAADAFSAAEQERMVRMCEVMGADWAELDVLRDRTSGLLYVVDVNTTPGAPVTALPPADLAAYWRGQEDGFADLVRGHVR